MPPSTPAAGTSGTVVPDRVDRFRDAPVTVAAAVAAYLAAQDVRRVYGLCGGHIQPLWDAVDRAGIDIVDVRHEAAAVQMAHGEAELTGRIGVALVTAGPGLTNAVTGIANAATARVPVLVLSARPPRPQASLGAMQDVPQAAIVSALCRRAESVTAVEHALARLDAAVEAALGGDGPLGPSYVDFPSDLLDERLHPADADPAWFGLRRTAPVLPSDDDVARAEQLVRRASRLVVIGGRGTQAAGRVLSEFLETTGAVYLDTAESRGAVPHHHGSAMPAVRGRALREADVVVTLGRRLDFQLAYGSAAAFAPTVRFLRVGRSSDETNETRRADVEVRGDVGEVLARLVARHVAPADPDHEWIRGLRAENAARCAGLAARLRDEPDGHDGRMHPYRLIGAVNDVVDDRSIVVADGGDILSFARVGLRTTRYLDCGALGCLGVGVPFAVAAALSHPDDTVVAIVGDGSLGFTAMELDTARRHGARAVFVVANNEAWNIERTDQAERYGNLVGVDLPGCRYDLVARGLGLHSERVEDASGLPDALARALDRAPALLDVAVTRDAPSPDSLSGLAAVPARHALRSWHEAETAARQLPL